MIRYTVSIKSGTGGWSDYDGCDYTFGEITTPCLPRIGETIMILRDSEEINPTNKKPYQQYTRFLVRDIEHYYIPADKTRNQKSTSGITVYVVPIESFKYN